MKQFSTNSIDSIEFHSEKLKRFSKTSDVIFYLNSQVYMRLMSNLNLIYDMALWRLILLPFLILGAAAERRDEMYQLVGAFRGVVISVHEKIQLQRCSLL